MEGLALAGQYDSIGPYFRLVDSLLIFVVLAKRFVHLWTELYQQSSEG